MNSFTNFSADSIGVINGDQAELSGVSYHHPVIRFGFKTTNQIQARKVKLENDGVYLLKENLDSEAE